MRARIPLLALLFLVAPAWACAGDWGRSATQAPTAEPTPPGPIVTPFPAALPDLVVTGYRRDPPEPLPVPPGSKVYFHILVTNKGSAPYGGWVRVVGPGNHDGMFQGLLPGETKEAVVELAISMSNGSASGITFTVDPDNLVEETNEANNDLGPLTVVYGG